MRARAVDKALRKGPLTEGQKAAVKLILAERDRVVGVQGYAGSGKTTMLSRARALLEKRGFEVRGLAPSASAARTLEGEAGDRRRDPAALPRALRRRCGRADDREGRKGNARRLREVRARCRRGLARLHRPGPRPLEDRRPLAHPPRGAGGRREAARRRGCRQALRAAPGRRHEDRR